MTQNEQMVLEALKNGRQLTAKDAVLLTGLAPYDVKEACKTLMKAGKIRFTDEKQTLIAIVPDIAGLTPEFEGQRVRIMYSWKDSVHAGEALYIRYDAEGNVTHTRSATDLEVQWWMLYQLLRELAAQRNAGPTPDSI